MSLIATLGRQRQLDLREFKTSLVYIIKFQVRWATKWDPNKQTDNMHSSAPALGVHHHYCLTWGPPLKEKVSLGGALDSEVPGYFT